MAVSAPSSLLRVMATGGMAGASGTGGGAPWACGGAASARVLGRGRREESSPHSAIRIASKRRRTKSQATVGAAATFGDGRGSAEGKMSRTIPRKVKSASSPPRETHLTHWIPTPIRGAAWRRTTLPTRRTRCGPSFAAAPERRFSLMALGTRTTVASMGTGSAVARNAPPSEMSRLGESKRTPSM